MLKKLIILTMAVFFMSTSNNPAAAGQAAEAAYARPSALALTAPYAVNLSPNIAEIKVRETVVPRRITPESREFSLFVPANVNPDTFPVLIPGRQVANIGFRSLPPAEDSPESPRGRLLAALEALRLEKARLEGQKSALEARIKLWTTPPADYSASDQPVDLDKLDAGLASRLPGLYAELAALPDKIDSLGLRIAFYEKELAALGGKRQEFAEAVVSFNASGSRDEPLEVEYSYYSYGCGWQPVYSFAAQPEKSLVDFRQQAYLWQNSGQDWNGARIVLSTKAPDFRLAPGDLRPWQLRRAEEQEVTARSKVMYEMAAPAPAQALADAGPAEAPVSMQRSTHLEWDLGRRNLPSGTPVTLSLKEEAWKAEFYYTLRPSLSTESFLTAEIKLPEAVELSRGRAVFLLEDRLCGSNQNFAANSDQFELFFGKDDRVSVKMVDLLRQQGKEGFFSTTNTYNWEWKITVSNRRDREISVRVEEPEPRAMDKSIKLEVESTPRPELEDQVYVWKEKIAAGKDLEILHKVSASASGAQRLIPGR